MIFARRFRCILRSRVNFEYQRRQHPRRAMSSLQQRVLLGVSGLSMGIPPTGINPPVTAARSRAADRREYSFGAQACIPRPGGFGRGWGWMPGSNPDMPCKDCPDRKPGCHGCCEDYAKMRAKLDLVHRRKQAVQRGTPVWRRDTVLYRWPGKKGRSNKR